MKQKVSRKVKFTVLALVLDTLGLALCALKLVTEGVCMAYMAAVNLICGGYFVANVKRHEQNGQTLSAPGETGSV